MNEKQMHNRCRAAHLVGKGELGGYEFSINYKGYATVVPNPRAKVYGIIWKISRADEARLDVYEEFADGLYGKARKSISRLNYSNAKEGGTLRVFFYCYANRKTRSARKKYLLKIISAAKKHKLPKNYIREIVAKA